MKILPLFALVVIALPIPDAGNATAPEENYLAARERSIKSTAYRASGKKDQEILNRLHKAEDETDAAYRGCFAERAPRDPNFKALTAQAKAIVDALPMK